MVWNKEIPVMKVKTSTQFLENFSRNTTHLDLLHVPGVDGGRLEVVTEGLSLFRGGRWSAHGTARASNATKQRRSSRCRKERTCSELTGGARGLRGGGWMVVFFLPRKFLSVEGQRGGSKKKTPS